MNFVFIDYHQGTKWIPATTQLWWKSKKKMTTGAAAPRRTVEVTPGLRKQRTSEMVSSNSVYSLVFLSVMGQVKAAN